MRHSNKNATMSQNRGLAQTQIIPRKLSYIIKKTFKCYAKQWGVSGKLSNFQKKWLQRLWFNIISFIRGG